MGAAVCLQYVRVCCVLNVSVSHAHIRGMCMSRRVCASHRVPRLLAVPLAGGPAPSGALCSPPACSQEGPHLALVVDVLVLVDLALHVRVRVRVHIRVEFGVKLGADSRAWAQQVLGGCWGAQLLTQPHTGGAAEGGWHGQVLVPATVPSRGGRAVCRHGRARRGRARLLLGLAEPEQHSAQDENRASWDANDHGPRQARG